MSRFILGDCVQVMSRFPARAVDFILTDPPYLVGYKDRTGRTLAGDNSAEWLQPACHEMYRVLKNDSLMVSFYAWNRADLFLNAWKAAGFRVVGHIVFAKSYASKSTFVGYTHESTGRHWCQHGAGRRVLSGRLRPAYDGRAVDHKIQL